mgnify:CR=1 FL=1|tara:strand:+ start:1429 stop:1854 length:426 start_codon:yes stop_codon:yes gene_type:complete
MATINASVTINSDITGGNTNITKSMTMTKFGTSVGLENTSGLNAKTVQSTTAFKLFDHSEGDPAKRASKVYIRNTGSSSTDFFYIGFGEDLAAATIETIGRLYGGNWMLIPWDAVNASTHDIYAKSSTVETMTLEFMAFID